jgi:phosphoribosyl-AMP cyclohydrolase
MVIDKEETDVFQLDFDKINSITGVVPVAVQNIETDEVILVAYTNPEAIEHSIKTGFATFWSTSRNELWIKGETSGNHFELIELRVNCEQNALVYKVKPQNGGICHTKNSSGEARNCFYRKLNFETSTLLNTNI